ncbi:MAG: ABC transporter ATP-binding protein [Thermoproteota archaeon]|nr:ABC transporter ATP-binding protein [Candidatus Brockarchaeota archaeon]
MVSVRIRNLTKVYGKIAAVKDVNLDVNDKEFFILLGPSGCGKTTLLLCIAGLLKPEKGEIWLGDKLVTSGDRNIFLPPQERKLAMVFQDYALYPHMTVFKNIAFPLEVGGISKDSIRERVLKVARFLGIEHLLDRKPKQLSGGEKQRVALGRAIVKEPALLLMDEPLANLDAKLRVLMRVELKRLQRELGTTIIYVTHDQVEAMSMADRVGVMSAGVLQQVGEPLEIYDKPRNTFVAGFIGSPPMNMFEGSVIDVNGRLAIDLGFSVIYLASWMEELLRKNNVEEVVLGVRPENVLFAKEGEVNAFKAKVSYVELLGKELNIHLAAGDKRLVMTAEPTLKPEGELWIRFNENKIYLFDRKTGNSLIL